jgi:hypothetical protein
MTIAAVFSALVGLPLTFALDTAETLTGGHALVLGGVVWLAGLLLVLVRPEH